jgi:hypothetical protein
MQVVQAPFQQPGELGPLRRSVHHRLERLASHVGVGHPRIGELADISRDAVQLVERQPPGGRACAAGVDQRAVDVEQDRDPFGGQGNLLMPEPSGSGSLRAGRDAGGRLAHLGARLIATPPRTFPNRGQQPVV